MILGKNITRILSIIDNVIINISLLSFNNLNRDLDSINIFRLYLYIPLLGEELLEIHKKNVKQKSLTAGWVFFIICKYWFMTKLIIFKR